MKGDPIDLYCEQLHLAMRQRLALLIEVCDTIDYVHGEDVIHRDLHPRNLIVSKGSSNEPCVKVIDFGLACIRGASGAWTKVVPAGTDGYAAPETRAGKTESLSPTADVFSLGSILRTLLKDSPTVGDDLEWIVNKATTQLLADRYPSTAALGSDLRRYLAGQILPGRRLSWLRRALRWPRRHPRALSITVACVCAVGLLFTAAVFAARVIQKRDGLTRQVQDLEGQLTIAQSDYSNLDKSNSAALAQVYAGRIHSARTYVSQGEVRSGWRELYESRTPQRGWEWRFLAGEVDQSRTVVGRSMSGFTKAAHVLVGAGELIRAGAMDGSIWGWDARTADADNHLTFKFTKKLHQAPVIDLTLIGADNGYAVSVAADGSVCVWRTQTGQLIASDSQALGRARLISSLEKQWAAPYHAQHVAALSSTGEWLCWLGDREAKLFHIGGPRAPLQIEQTTALVLKDGQKLKWGEDQDAWATWDEESSPPRLVTLLRRKVAGKEQGSCELVFWDVATVKAADPIRFNGLQIQSVIRVSRSRMFATDGARPVLVDLEALAKKKPKAFRQLPEQSDDITAVALAPNGSTLASGGGVLDKAIRLVNGVTFEPGAISGGLVHELKGHGNAVTSLEFCRAGASLISASLDGTVRVWGVQRPPKSLAVRTEESQREPNDWRRRIVRARFSRGPGSLALVAASLRPAVHAWDIQNADRNAVLNIDSHNKEDPWVGVGDVGINDDGRLIAAGIKTAKNRHLLLVWPLQRPMHKGSIDLLVPPLDLGNGPSSAPAIAVHTLGEYLAGATPAASEDHILVFKRTASSPLHYEQVAMLPKSLSPVEGLDFSPDGKLLAAVCQDGRLLIWEVETGHTHVYSQKFISGTLKGVRFSPDSSQVGVTTSQGIAHICQIRFVQGKLEETPAITFEAHDGNSIYRLCFQPGVRSARFATGTMADLRIWNSASFPYVKLLDFDIPGFDIDLDSRGEILAAAGSDKIILLRDFSRELSARPLYFAERALAFSLLARWNNVEEIKRRELPKIVNTEPTPDPAVVAGAQQILEGFGDDPGLLSREAFALLEQPGQGRAAQALRMAQMAHDAWVKDLELVRARTDIGFLEMVLGAATYRDLEERLRKPNESGRDPGVAPQRKPDEYSKAADILKGARKQLQPGSPDDLRALAYVTMASARNLKGEDARRFLKEYKDLVGKLKVQNYEFDLLRREAQGVVDGEGTH